MPLRARRPSSRSCSKALSPSLAFGRLCRSSTTNAWCPWSRSAAVCVRSIWCPQTRPGSYRLVRRKGGHLDQGTKLSPKGRRLSYLCTEREEGTERERGCRARRSSDSAISASLGQRNSCFPYRKAQLSMLILECCLPTYRDSALPYGSPLIARKVSPGFAQRRIPWACASHLWIKTPAGTILFQVPRYMMPERLFCGHIYHLRCLETYINNPPFDKGCKVCGQTLSHHKFCTDAKVLESRWAFKEARQREIDDVKELML
mmetsp:Transcript_42751/g.101484  ORF Transcript_42751/g.101484 Transcript_42751/m.101484 type:complete len:260 (-) Transcript_42751:516-1295(-)